MVTCTLTCGKVICILYPPPNNTKIDQTWDFILSTSKIKSRNIQRGQAGEFINKNFNFNIFGQQLPAKKPFKYPIKGSF